MTQQMLMRKGIIIDCPSFSSRQARCGVPQTLTNDERYAEYTDKLASRGLAPKANGYPWMWRGKKKIKSTLDKKPKRKKRIMETISI